jgi:ABC-2 type transport system permease protein
MAVEGLWSVWLRRELMWSLAIRNVKVKYQNSTFGFLWTLLNPTLTAVVLIVVFSYILRLSIDNYWAFLISGFFVWNFLLQVLNAGTYTIAEHSPLAHSVSFPMEVLILGVAISRMVEFLLELSLVMLVLVVFLHQGVPASFALVPLLLVLQVLLCLGLTLPIAALAVFFRDVQHALPIVLFGLFYITPIFYPASLVPEEFRFLFFANPLAHLLTLYHVVLYEGVFPSAAELARTAAISFAAILIGYGLFCRYKRYFAEIV